MARGAHKLCERGANLRQRRVFDGENAVENAVDGEQNRGLAREAVGNAHVHKAHKVRTAAEHLMPFDKSANAAAGEIFKLADVPGRAVVFLHKLRKAVRNTRAGGADKRSRIGDHLFGGFVGEDFGLLNGHCAFREEVAVGDNYTAAGTDVAQTGPARNRGAAFEDAVCTEQEGQGER